MLSQHTNNFATFVSPKVTPGQPAKILVADDEPDILKLIELYLKRVGYAVVLAANGLEALEKAQQENPDLIILDRMMPGMDGLSVCRELRRNSSQVGILMITGLGADDDQRSGLEAGADDYMVKPFALRELVTRVETLLQKT